jgi:hypothetical protein
VPAVVRAHAALPNPTKREPRNAHLQDNVKKVRSGDGNQAKAKQNVERIMSLVQRPQKERPFQMWQPVIDCKRTLAATLSCKNTCKLQPTFNRAQRTVPQSKAEEGNLQVGGQGRTGLQIFQTKHATRFQTPLEECTDVDQLQNLALVRPNTETFA